MVFYKGVRSIFFINPSVKTHKQVGFPEQKYNLVVECLSKKIFTKGSREMHTGCPMYIITCPPSKTIGKRQLQDVKCGKATAENY